MDHTRNATKVDVYQLEGNMTPSCDFHLLYHKLTYFISSWEDPGMGLTSSGTVIVFSITYGVSFRKSCVRVQNWSVAKWGGGGGGGALVPVSFKVNTDGGQMKP